MPAPFRSSASLAIAGLTLTGWVFAQAAPPPQPPPQQPAAGAAPAGRGAGRQGAEGAGRGRGQRRGGFTQYTRELAPQDVIVRGKSLYEANCASCHAADLRGTPQGANLLRSGVALNDDHGELVAASVAKHTPSLTLVQADTVAIAEYIHSVHATMGGQGSPPGRNPTNVTLNVLVGDPRNGETEFSARCAGCHTGERSLNGIASKYPDPRMLQNTWFVGAAGVGGRGGGGAGQEAVVTLADGTKLEGTLVRNDSFLVVLTLPDGTRKSFARTDGVPGVEIKDPREAHKGMAMKLIFDDPDNKKMHDITAFLATMK